MPSFTARIVGVLVATSLSLPARARGVEPASPAADADEVGAEAPALGDDEVLLRGGGMVRGTVVEVVPDGHVTIVVGGTHERRTIPWAEVDEVLRDKHARPKVIKTTPMPTEPRTPVQDAAAGDAEERPPEPTGPGAPRLHLQVRGDREVVLNEITATLVASGPGGTIAGVEFQPVCRAPCDRVVDGRDGRAFFLSGDRVTPSRKFTLLDREGDVTLEVRPGHRALYLAGWFSTVFGLVGAATGAVLLATSDDDADLRTAGAVVLGVGAPVLAGGIVMLLFGRTRMRFVGPAPQPRK